MPEYVSNYGVHWADGDLAYLEQGDSRGGLNVQGVNAKSPFIVRSYRNRPCNHRIPMTNTELSSQNFNLLCELSQDSLFDYMSPFPHNPNTPIYLEDPGGYLQAYVIALSRLSSPIEPIVFPMWCITIKGLSDKLRRTNIQPLVVTKIGAGYCADINNLVDISTMHVRQLILLGESDVILPSIVHHIETKIHNYKIEDILDLPLELFGSIILRKWMKKQWPCNKGE